GKNEGCSRSSSTEDGIECLDLFFPTKISRRLSQDVNDVSEAFGITLSIKELIRPVFSNDTQALEFSRSLFRSGRKIQQNTAKRRTTRRPFDTRVSKLGQRCRNIVNRTPEG